MRFILLTVVLALTTVTSFATEVFSGQGWQVSNGKFDISISRDTTQSDDRITLSITPIDGTPSICGDNFTVIQNGIQYDDFQLINVVGSGHCGNVYISSTFTLSYSSHSSTPPDWTQAFTLLSHDYGGGLHTVEIPAAVDNSVAFGSTRWQVAELYMATMGYAMDVEGLNYWVNNIESGQLDGNGQPWTIDTVAQAFFNVDLVQAKYPATLSNSDFIDEIYRNIFGHEADIDGLNHWVTELSAGTPRALMIRALILGGWANTTAEAQADMQRFRNRTEVALAYAQQQQELGIEYSALSEVGREYLIAAGAMLIEYVTQDEATRDTAIDFIAYLLSPLSPL